jgi:methionyl-tRNA formyltransferase
MRISVVCTDRQHPVFAELERWCAHRAEAHEVVLSDTLDGLPGGDLLFLISCSRIVTPALRARYRHSLVVHASDLPVGRGWSPLIWQILEGRQDVAVTLLEAQDPVDSGAIWTKRWLHFAGHELCDEINAALFAAELELMDYALAHCDALAPQAQDEARASWYRRRTPKDNRIDPHRSLAEQFDLLRVADPARYPAFFELRGQRYEISIRKTRDQDD